MGEVWSEITEEFKQEGVRPITPDLDCIQSVEDVVISKIQGVIGTQNNILESSKQVYFKLIIGLKGRREDLL